MSEADLARLGSLRDSLRGHLGRIQDDISRFQIDLHKLKASLLDIEVLCELAKRGSAERSGTYSVDGEDADLEPIFELDEKCAGVYSDSALDVLKSDPTHTLSVELQVPADDPSSREWIINIGQRTTGAHHWLYNPRNEFPRDGEIQFGGWSITPQVTKRLPESVKEKSLRGEWTRITSTYSHSSRVYKVYVDGVLHDSVSGVSLSLIESQVCVGDAALPSESGFTGSIKSVRIWAAELSESQVAELPSSE